jgi:hypothetical protein
MIFYLQNELLVTDVVTSFSSFSQAISNIAAIKILNNIITDFFIMI